MDIACPLKKKEEVQVERGQRAIVESEALEEEEVMRLRSGRSDGAWARNPWIGVVTESTLVWWWFCCLWAANIKVVRREF